MKLILRIRKKGRTWTFWCMMIAMRRNASWEFCWTLRVLWSKYYVFSCETMHVTLRIRCLSLAKNDSQLHQKWLFAFEKSLWNVTWALELYKKHSQWGCCKAAAKHSLCNQDLGDGLPRWWQALWKLLVGNKVLTCSELLTLPSLEQQPPLPNRSQQSDSLRREKRKDILQVASRMVSVHSCHEKVKYNSRNEPFAMLQTRAGWPHYLL